MRELCASFYVESVVSAVPLALWSCDFERARDDESFPLTAGPVCGAFVAVVQVTHESAAKSARVQPEDIRFGRTNAAGWVVTRTLETLGAAEDVPPAPREIADAEVFSFDGPYFQLGEQCAEPSLLYGMPNEEYRIFWTYDREHFEHFAADLALDAEATLTRHRARRYVVQPHDPSAVEKELALLESEHERALVARFLLSSSDAGYHSGTFARDYRTAAVFDVTPASLRALFQAQFLGWYAQAVMKNSGPSLNTLYRAKGLVEAARVGSPEAELEASLWCDKDDPLNRAGQYLWCESPEHLSRVRYVFAKYREYAWRCATGGVRRRPFEDSLPTRIEQLSQADRAWRDAADKIGQETTACVGQSRQAVHPVFDKQIHEGELLLGPVAAKAILTYFSLYSMGAKLTKDEAARASHHALERALSDCAVLPERVEQAMRSLLTPARCEDVFGDVAYCCVDYRRARLLEQYVESCAEVDFHWWRPLSGVDAPRALWLELKPVVRLLAASLKSAGKSMSSIVEPHLAAHKLALAEAHGLLEALYRNEVLCEGVTVDPRVHFLEKPDPKLPNYRALIDIRNGKVTVTREHPGDVGRGRKYEFSLVVEHAPSSLQGPGRRYALADKLERSYARDLVVPADLAALEQRHKAVPKAFQLVAESVNLVYAVQTVVATLSNEESTGNERFVALIDVATGVYAVIDSYRVAAKALSAPLPPETFLGGRAKQAFKPLGAVMGVLDGYSKLSKGYTILFSEDGDVAFELRQGRSVRAQMQTVKGSLQVALGALALIGAIPGTAALVASTPALVLAIGGGLVVAAIDEVLDMTSDYVEHITRFERALDKARRVEFADGTSLRASRDVEQLIGRMNELHAE